MSAHSAERDAAPSWMSAEATVLYGRAEALAAQRGCVVENDCWIDCMDAAIEEAARILPPAVCSGCGHGAHVPGLCEADEQPACNCLTDSDTSPGN